MSIFKNNKNKDIDSSVETEVKKTQVKKSAVKKTKTPTKVHDKNLPAKESMKDLYATGEGNGKKAKSNRGKKFSESYRVLVKPLIAEKAAELNKHNKYVFAVDTCANKIMVARAIEDVYGIKPTGVNIINVVGKKKRTGKVLGRRKDWKKAVVTLPKDKTIQIYEGV